MKISPSLTPSSIALATTLLISALTCHANETQTFSNTELPDSLSIIGSQELVTLSHLTPIESDGTQDGAALVDTKVGLNIGARYTFADSMQPDQMLNTQVVVFNPRTSFIRYEVRLINVQDNVVLARRPVTSTQAFTISPGDPSITTAINYETTASDAGDNVAIEIIKITNGNNPTSDENGARDFAIDSISLTVSEIELETFSAPQIPPALTPIGSTTLVHVSNDADNGDGDGDGAILIDTPTGLNVGARYTFTRPMQLGQNLSGQAIVWNSRNSFLRYEARLINVDDNMEIARLPLNPNDTFAFDAGNDTPLTISFTHTPSINDQGDQLAIDFLKVVDGDQGRDLSIDSISIANISTATILPPHSITSAPTTVDQDGNGLPDTWEALYNARGIDPSADSDGDGSSNLQESAFGTDPFDPLNFFEYSFTRNANNTATISWSNLPGRPGILQSSTDLNLTDAWAPHPSTPFLANGRRNVIDALDLERNFFRIQSSETDLDGDQVPDWIEPLLGFASTPGDAASVLQEQSYDTDGDGNLDITVSGDLAAFNEIYRTPEPGVALTRAQASRLLIQSTFGPASMGLVDYVASIGPEAWIDEQVARPATLLEPYIIAAKADLIAEPFGEWTDPDLSGYTINGSPEVPRVGGRNFTTPWMRAALQGDDQLRQRVAFALSQILVISRRSTALENQVQTMTNYYDMLVNQAFGNYAELLLDVSLKPGMGNYLSHRGNRRADPSINRFPDENYAREIMQLFSIGLWELNPDGTQKLDANGEPIPTYDNDDITEIARIFTGVNFASNTFGSAGFNDDGDTPNQWTLTPMTVFASEHDWEAKNIPIGIDANGNRLFHTIPARTNNRTNFNAREEVVTLVNRLVNHPNCAPFISRALIQFLVTSNPSPAYVERVSSVFTDNGSGETGDLEAVVRAILLDDEARNPRHHLTTAHFGHYREPTVRLVHLARMLRCDQYPNLVWWDFDTYGDASLQEPMAAPSVFNFYRPDFRLFGTLAENQLDSPALGIVNSFSSVSYLNYLWRVCENGLNHPSTIAFTDNKTFPADLSRLLPLASDIPSLLDHLSILYCAGTLGAESREKIRTVLAAEPNLTERARLAAFLVLISPEGSCLK